MTRSQEEYADLNRIWALIHAGEIKRAEVQLARALRNAAKDREKGAILLARAQCKLLSGRPQEALEDWSQARELAADAARQPAALQLRADANFALYELSSVGFAGQDGLQTSARLYRQLIAAHPQYENLGWLHYQLGRACLAANQMEEAAQQFQRALAARNTLPALRAFCCERLAFLAYYEERDLQRARGFLQQALRLYPAESSRGWLVEILLMRARVARDLAELAEARASIEGALRLANGPGGQRANTLYAASEILMKLPGQEEAVIPLLEEFLQLSKRAAGMDVSRARAYELLGEAHFRKSRYADAAHAFRQALHHNPYSPWSANLRYRLACAQYQSGDYDRACESLQRLLATEADEGGAVQDFRVYDLLGNAQFALGRFDEALESYQRALALTPAHSQESAQIRRYQDYALRHLDR